MKDKTRLVRLNNAIFNGNNTAMVIQINMVRDKETIPDPCSRYEINLDFDKATINRGIDYADINPNFALFQPIYDESCLAEDSNLMLINKLTYTYSGLSSVIIGNADVRKSDFNIAWIEDEKKYAVINNLVNDGPMDHKILDLQGASSGSVRRHFAQRLDLPNSIISLLIVYPNTVSIPLVFGYKTQNPDVSLLFSEDPDQIYSSFTEQFEFYDELVTMKKSMVIALDTEYYKANASFGSYNSTLKAIKNAKWDMYLRKLNEIHTVVDDTDNRDILNDSILVGRFCLIIFENCSSELYHFYKAIKYTRGLNDMYSIFKKFINANYSTGIIKFKDGINIDSFSTMAVLFSRFCSSVEIAVDMGSALSGYNMFTDLYEIYLDSDCINSRLYNSHKYSLINYISEAMKSYRYIITNFANSKFDNNDPFVLYLFKSKYFDKYKKYEKIIHYSVIEKESDIKYIRDDIAPEFITITYSFLLNVLNDNIHQKYRKTIVNFLTKNYIINENEKQYYLNER